MASSLTVASVEVNPALPCCRMSGAATLTAGALLMVKVNVAVLVAAQLSVAVTVTV